MYILGYIVVVYCISLQRGVSVNEYYYYYYYYYHHCTYSDRTKVLAPP
jgi:hypothetical protein